jgi:hypothetical protein
MALQNPTAPASFDFARLVAAQAIPGVAQSTTSNPAGGFPNTGGNNGGITGAGSIDDILKSSNINTSIIVPSLASVAPIPEAALAGDPFKVADVSTLTIRSDTAFKPLAKANLGIVSEANIAGARFGLGKGIVPSQQGQGQTLPQ